MCVILILAVNDDSSGDDSSTAPAPAAANSAPPSSSPGAPPPDRRDTQPATIAPSLGPRSSAAGLPNGSSVPGRPVTPQPGGQASAAGPGVVSKGRESTGQPARGGGEGGATSSLSRGLARSSPNGAQAPLLGGAGGAGGAGGPPRGEARRGASGDSPWRGASQGSASDDGSGPVRVLRFTQSGGAGLKGQVIDADNGKPLAGVVIEAHIKGKFMEAATDASGAFRMAGLLPGKRVKVWMIENAFVAEYVEVQLQGEGETSDLGVVRLLSGNEIGGQLGGWVGLFVGRRNSRNVVTAVNPWLPADRAGIETGDVILSVDGRNLEGLGPRAAGFLLRGPVGTRTSITLQNREGVTRQVEMERVSR